VFTWKDKDALIVGAGGKLYLFDPASLASGPVATGGSNGPAGADAGALASWIDAGGVRWVATATGKGVTAFRIVDQGGTPAFQPGWSSAEIASPLPPLVVNGVLFAVSSGTRAAPAVLHALDASNGRSLWTSGRAITTSVMGGLSAGGGTVFVPGADGTLYAFGFDIEK